MWAGRAIVLLVAAAPCALVMSTPVAGAAAIGRAGRSGGMALEALGRVRIVAMDKTGTLTRGSTSPRAWPATGVAEARTVSATVGP